MGALFFFLTVAVIAGCAFLLARFVFKKINDQVWKWVIGAITFGAAFSLIAFVVGWIYLLNVPFTR